jgi:hypothetical protein
MSGSPTCAMCGCGITGFFYRVGPQEICPPCRDQATGDAAALPTASSREVSGLLGMLLGALLGSVAYAALLLLFSWYGGFAATFVGFAVGAGLKTGTRGRVSTAYRFLAVWVTYAALVLGQTPCIAMEGGGGLSEALARLPESLGWSLILPVTGVLRYGTMGFIFDIFVLIAFAAAWGGSGSRAEPSAITGPFRLS